MAAVKYFGLSLAIFLGFLQLSEKLVIREKQDFSIERSQMVPEAQLESPESPYNWIAQEFSEQHKLPDYSENFFPETAFSDFKPINFLISQIRKTSEIPDFHRDLRNYISEQIFPTHFFL